MTQTLIETASATGEEVNTIVSAVEEVLVGQDRGKVLIALLSLVMVIMNPTISPEDLQKALQDISQYICLYLDGTETTQQGEDAKKGMN